MWYDLIYVCKRHSFSVIGVNSYVQNVLNMQAMELKKGMTALLGDVPRYPFCSTCIKQ